MYTAIFNIALTDWKSVKLHEYIYSKTTGYLSYSRQIFWNMALHNQLVAVYILLLNCLVTSSLADIACTFSDCIIYDISTQTSCTEVISEAPTNDCRWSAGLQSNADLVITGGKIVAYKIQWFYGGWSNW